MDDKFDLPDYSKDQKLFKRTMSMRYKEIVDYIVSQLALNEEGTSNYNYNQADINRHVTEIVRELEKDIAVQTEQVIEKSFLDGQAHHLATAYHMSKRAAKKLVKKINSGTKETTKLTESEMVKPNNAVDYSKPSYSENFNTDSDIGVLEKMAKLTLKKNGVTKKDTLKIISQGKIQKNFMRALMSDTYEDILYATHNTEESLKRVVRESVRDVVQYHGLLNNGYSDQATDLKKRLTKKGLSERIVKDGFVGVIDRAGRKWDLGTYSDMVVKTKTNQSFMQGVQYEAEELGMDLAVISSHGAKDKCRNWEGVVVSLSGKTEGYPSLADVKATNEIFHPNCEHKLHSIRNLDQLHVDDIKKHKINMQKVKGYKNRVYKRKPIKK